MKALYDNKTITAVPAISSYSENPYYSFAPALAEYNLTRRGRTIGLDSEWLLFDFGAPISADACVILGNNLTPGASVVIQGNASDSWTAPAFSQTLEYNDETWTALFSAAQSFRYWRLIISDLTNTDGFIEIGYVFLGPAITMPSVDSATAMPWTATSITSKSISGQLNGDRRPVLKSASIIFKDIDQTDRAIINTFFKFVDIVIPFILIFWENDLDVEPPLFCAWTAAPDWTMNQYSGTWKLTIPVEECK